MEQAINIEMNRTIVLDYYLTLVSNLAERQQILGNRMNSLHSPRCSAVTYFIDTERHKRQSQHHRNSNSECKDG